MIRIAISAVLLASAGLLSGCVYDDGMCTTGNCNATTTYVPTTTYVAKTTYVPRTTYVPATSYVSTTNCCSTNCCPTCSRCGYDYGYNSYDIGWF